MTNFLVELRCEFLDQNTDERESRLGDAAVVVEHSRPTRRVRKEWIEEAISTGPNGGVETLYSTS